MALAAFGYLLYDSVRTHIMMRVGDSELRFSAMFSGVASLPPGHWLVQPLQAFYHPDMTDGVKIVILYE